MDEQERNILPDEILLLCSKCGPDVGLQPLSAFRKSPKRRHGVRKTCRRCMQAREAEKRREYPEKHQAKLAYIKTWHDTHPDYNDEWLEKHPGYRKSYSKAYREENRELVLENARNWRRKNPDHVRTYGKNYRVTHQEQLKAWRKGYCHPYYLATKAAHIARARLRRFRILHAPVLEIFTDQEIFLRDNWICQICIKKVYKKLTWPHPMSASIDHVIPVARGGVHSRQNVVLAHLICNSRKGHRVVTQQQRLF